MRIKSNEVFEVINFARELSEDFFYWLGGGWHLGEKAYKKGIEEAKKGVSEKEVKKFLSENWSWFSYFSDGMIDEKQATEIEKKLTQKIEDFYLIIADELEEIARKDTLRVGVKKKRR